MIMLLCKLKVYSACTIYNYQAIMRQFGPGSVVSSKVNLSAEIVSWSPCLVNTSSRLVSTIVDERRVTLCTGESACMLTGRRDTYRFNDLSEKQQQQIKE